MPSYRVTAPDGRTFNVTAPEGTSQADVLSRVKGQAEQSSLDLPLDLGVMKDLGQLFIGGRAPEGLGDYAKIAAMSIPAIAAGGVGGAAVASRLPTALRALAPYLGRALAAGGLGGTRAAVRGGDTGEIAGSALLDAGLTAATEGVLSGVGGGVKMGPLKLGLKEWGAPVQAFEAATKAPGEAAKALESAYIPKGWGAWLRVPSIDPKTTMTLTDAAAKLSKLEGPAYELARMEIVDGLKAAEKMIGPTPAKAFEQLTRPARFTPPASAQVAESARTGLTHPGTRATLDALMASPIDEGLPMGAGLGALIAPGLMHRLTGGRTPASERTGGY